LRWGIEAPYWATTALLLAIGVWGTVTLLQRNAVGATVGLWLSVIAVWVFFSMIVLLFTAVAGDIFI
jgi:hypothetical protein